LVEDVVLYLVDIIVRATA